MSFYDQTAASSIVSRVTNDTQAVADMFSTVFQVWFHLFTFSNHIGDHV